jgi:cytochrome c2
MHTTIPAALTATFGWLAIAGAAAAAPAAATASGQTYFERNCASCHTADAGMGSRAGPGLFNVVGRKAAGVPGFNYTDALSKAGAAGKTWTREELDVFLRDPSKDVPGTAMPIGIADAKQRAAVIDYLAAQRGKVAAAATAAAPKAAGGDKAGAWTEDKPGDLHHITVANLVQPFASESAGNGPKVAARPDGALPAVPKGFKVTTFAADSGKARLALRAPNGDILLADTDFARQGRRQGWRR